MKKENLTIQWLQSGDPSIRWQTLRDLENKSLATYTKERIKIASEGWGRRLLEKQDQDGNWGGGIYNPKWISTTYTLLLLRQMGLRTANIQALKACRILLDKGLYRDGGINYFPSLNSSETCVTGMVLSVLSYFGYTDARVSSLVEYLLGEQMDDGGWNCQRYLGARHSSFHTTISVLEGLWYYLQAYPASGKRLNEPRNRAHEFLLRHHLYKSDKTGKVVDHKMTRLSFPPQWRYDILRCLDYFQMSGLKKDKRMADAIELLIRKKLPDGKWALQQRYSGRTFFEMETVGLPSRWNTLRAIRVLKWWMQ